MIEYRMTLNGPYAEPTCAGHDDISARQGYYVVAFTEDEARDIMLKIFPNETFTCQIQRYLHDSIRPGD